MGLGVGSTGESALPFPSEGWHARQQARPLSLFSDSLTHERLFFFTHPRRIATSSSSSSAPSAARAVTPDLLDLLYIAESPASTTGGGGASSYASTLSALLTVPLTLPVMPLPPSGSGDAQSSFLEKEIREWEDANAVLRTKLERGMVESAELWLDVLERVPLLVPADSESVEPESDSDTLPKRRIEYLEAVRTELDLVAARNPTRQVYALADDHAHDDDEVQDVYWRTLELKEREREERRQRRMEVKFERWLDEIFSLAEAAKAPGADPDSQPRGSSGGGGISNDDVAMHVKKRRDMLDVPVAGIGRPGPTWKDQLRVQWKSMFDPAADGGVLGHVEREMGNLAAQFGIGADDDDEAESRPSYDDGADNGWTPDPLPLMAAHHLRAQLASTIADLRSGASGGDGLFESPAHGEWERATLPPTLDAAWPDEFLSLEQLAIRIDRRARRWALRILRAVMSRRASSSPDEDRTIEPLSIRKRVKLLGAASSPFPAFMRTVDATFKIPRDPAHFRIGISQHDLANAIFALPADPRQPAMVPRGVMARGQGEGGCSALQRAKWRREAGVEGREEVERRLLRSRPLRGQQEGKDPQRAGARDEL